MCKIRCLSTEAKKHGVILKTPTRNPDLGVCFMFTDRLINLCYILKISESAHSSCTVHTGGAEMLTESNSPVILSAQNWSASKNSHSVLTAAPFLCNIYKANCSHAFGWGKYLY